MLERHNPEIELITIHVNGVKKEIPDGLKLAALLDWLKLPGDRVAVEHNLEIVPRNLWNATVLNDGDRLEVVHFVGGGSDFRFWICDIEDDTGGLYNAGIYKFKIQNLESKIPK